MTTTDVDAGDTKRRTDGTRALDSGSDALGSTGRAVRWAQTMALEARRSPATVPALLAVLSLTLSIVFVMMNLDVNKGQLIAPLDDAYIHLQYGREIGSGYGFAYNPGDPPSAGASSFLYALILGVAWALGAHGTALLVFAVNLGALCVAGTVVLVHQLGYRLVGPRVGLWAGLLTALSGPLLWGAVSGMEVGLVAVLLMGSLLAFVVEQPTARFRLTPLVATALALARPEGLIAALALVAGMLWTVGRAAHADGARRRPAVLARAWAILLPVVAGFGQVMFYWISTGSFEANGIQSKSTLHAGSQPNVLTVADATLRNAQNLLSTLNGLDAQDLVPPATFLAAVIGLVALGYTYGKRVLAGTLVIGLGTISLSVSSLVTAEWQNLRYVQPFLPLVLLLAVIGVHAAVGTVLGDASERHSRSWLVLHGLLISALVFTVAYTPTWGLRYAQQAATIREAPVSIGTWLGGHLPVGATVAVNDVGATAYFSRQRVLDLMGLGTNGFAEATNNGSGTLYEALRHLAPDRRPAFFSIYGSGGFTPVSELENSTVLGGPIASFLLKSPAHPIAGFAGPPCQTDRLCNRVDVRVADWSHADTGDGDRPDIAPPGAIRDYVNVGDLDSERKHGWSAQAAVPSYQPDSLVSSSAAVRPGRIVVDSARHVIGGESMTLHHLTPGQPVELTGRVQALLPQPNLPTYSRSVEVVANGHPAGEWDFVADRNLPWQQSTFTIPGELVTGSDLTLTTRPQQELLSPYPDYDDFGMWASQ